MNTPSLLTDEHVPGPCITVLRSIGHDVVLARNACDEGASDGRLLEFARENGCVVLTCDRRFTVLDGTRVSNHAGVIYAQQTALQRRPEDVADAIDRIFDTVPAEEWTGVECYLTDWLC
jgi:hypothetical protein